MQYAAVRGRRLLVAVQRVQDLAQAEVVARLAGGGRSGLFDERERSLRLPILQFQQAGAEQGGGVGRRFGQYVPVEFARFG